MKNTTGLSPVLKCSTQYYYQMLIQSLPENLKVLHKEMQLHFEGNSHALLKVIQLHYPLSCTTYKPTQEGFL